MTIHIRRLTAKTRIAKYLSMQETTGHASGGAAMPGAGCKYTCGKAGNRNYRKKNKKRLSPGSGCFYLAVTEASFITDSGCSLS